MPCLGSWSATSQLRRSWKHYGAGFWGPRSFLTELTVSGPMPLGRLHPYQAEIVDEFAPVIALRGVEARAKISLPTGAGKTRVAVEAAVKYVLATDHGSTHVLWVAQTDELCEQGVQSFRQVWANRGKNWTELRIVRLWGGNPDPMPSADDVPTVVVASIQTLTARLGADRLTFLKDCALVIIDESHHAITTSYTRLLDWFVPEEPTEDAEGMPPVVGLTATPFRGINEEETRRLANRFRLQFAKLHYLLRRSAMSAFGVCVQPISATPLVVYRLAFRSPRSFADVD